MIRVYDSGTLSLQRGVNTAPPGGAPVMELTEVWGSYYEARTVGVQRYYTAMEHAARADAVVRVPRYYGISPDTDRITLTPVDYQDTGVYKVLQVQQILDEDGLPATDITLERTGELDGSA